MARGHELQRLMQDTGLALILLSYFRCPVFAFFKRGSGDRSLAWVCRSIYADLLRARALCDRPFVYPPLAQIARDLEHRILSAIDLRQGQWSEANPRCAVVPCRAPTGLYVPYFDPRIVEVPIQGGLQRHAHL